VADYNKAIALKPDFAFAYFNRALAKQAKGDPEGSFADFKTANELSPGKYARPTKTPVFPPGN
jgi:tetratricopeptide (TPR) repeat protein